MKLELFKIADLKLDPENARKHNAKNLAAISKSFDEFDQLKNIVVDKNNVVIAGNGTVQTFIDKGKTEIWGVRSHLSEEKNRAFALADNRTAELAEWDTGNLEKVFEKLRASDIKLDDVGFEPADLDDLGLAPKNVGLTDDDAIPEVAQNIHGVKRGDIWQLGEHRIMCGDSTKKEDVERLMAGEKADMVFTDPPYGIGYEYSSHDDSSSEENEKLVANVFALHDCGKVWTPGLCNLARDISRFGKTKVAVWYKKFAAAGSGLGGASTWEPILIIKPQEKKLANDVFEVMTDRESLNGVSLRDLHSCPKPVALYEKLLESFSLVKASIVEPFCGSGSTLIACEKTNRKCYGMEIDEHYCSVIIERWQQFTGKKAVKLDLTNS